MKDKISKVLITMGLLILIGSFTLSLYSKSIENKALSNFEEKIKKEDNKKFALDMIKRVGLTE